MKAPVPNPPVQNLERKPEPLTATYKWADLVEIHCLVRKSRFLTLTDIAKLADADADSALDVMLALGNRADIDEADRAQVAGGQEGTAAELGSEDATDSEAGELPEDESPLETIRAKRGAARRRARVRDRLRPIRPVDAALGSDRRHVLAADVLHLLQWRAKLFGDAYPFTVDVDGDQSLIQRRAELSERQLLYVFLLMASGLAHLPKDAEQNFTYPFERLSAIALQEMFPTAVVEVFGTAASMSAGSDTRLRDKVKDLALRLKGTIGKDVDKLPDENRGDKGLDFVAHIPVGDDEEGHFVVFGQAACTDEWVTKQMSATPQRWKSTLQLQVPQFNVCTIPISFRRVGGAWHDLGELSETLLLDRSRLMHLVRDNFSDLEAKIVAGERTREHINAIVAYELVGPES